AKAFQDLPEGLRRLAQLVVDNVPGFVRGIIPQGQVDMPGIGLRLAPAQGNVALAGLAVVELAGQFAVTVRVPGNDQNARGFPVQTVQTLFCAVPAVLEVSY